jgi:hypothetical protein
MKASLLALAFAVSGVPLARAQSVADEGAESGLVIGVAPGLASYKGRFGPWLELFAGHDFRFGDGLGLRTELGGAFVQYGEEDSYQVVGGEDIDFSDEVEGIGVFARGLADVGVSSRASLQGGLLVGFAHVSMDSSLCGSASLDSAFVGLSAGTAFRFGAARRVELGALVDFVGFPLLRCAKSQPAPSVNERDELGFDDPTLGATLRLGYHW